MGERLFIKDEDINKGIEAFKILYYTGNDKVINFYYGSLLY